MKAAFVNAMVVGSGGFLGALARYGLSGLVHGRLPISTFPYGTLAVNLLGCFGIGLMAGLAESGSFFGPDVRRFALIGLLGGSRRSRRSASRLSPCSGTTSTCGPRPASECTWFSDCSSSGWDTRCPPTGRGR